MAAMLGHRLKALRENARMTQLSLSQILNISNTTLSQYESCVRVPSDEMKIKIAKYFNVSLDYLMGVDDQYFRINKSSHSLSPHEELLIRAYRTKPELQAAVDKLLDIEHEEAASPSRTGTA
jgi:transcriptional regulator with XRE-family HTH domain